MLGYYSRSVTRDSCSLGRCAELALSPFVASLAIGYPLPVAVPISKPPDWRLSLRLVQHLPSHLTLLQPCPSHGQVSDNP